MQPAGDGRARARRRRALAGLLLLALLVHLAFFGGIGALSIGAGEPPGAPVVAVRTIDAEPAQPLEPAAADAPEAIVPAAAPPPTLPRARPKRAPREPAQPNATAAPAALTADAAANDAAPMPAPTAAASDAASAPDIVAAGVPPARAESGGSEASAALPASSPASAASLLAAGEAPPPTYRPILPSPFTLLYEVRRGFLRGTGEIRWQPDGDSYSLTLQARIAGLTLLMQSSQGGIDSTGLVPTRFVDQRARRAAQAANFRRDAGVISYSGPQTQWQLLPGSQDRLSWMIQLAGIVTAQPQLLADGGRVSMVVVGARGEAAVWTLRFVGFDNVDTATGSVRAAKLVREGRSPSDTSAEVWLDPAHDYLPAHATLRNSAGDSEYDLLLERIEPGR